MEGAEQEAQNVVETSPAPKVNPGCMALDIDTPSEITKADLNQSQKHTELKSTEMKSNDVKENSDLSSDLASNSSELVHTQLKPQNTKTADQPLNSEMKDSTSTLKRKEIGKKIKRESTNFALRSDVMNKTILRSFRRYHGQAFE